MILGTVGYPTNGNAEVDLEVPWVEDEVQVAIRTYEIPKIRID
jgi:hypothetical protein